MIEPKQDNFNIDEVGPEYWFHWKHDEKDDCWYEDTESRKKRRMNDRFKFNAVYPDVSFEDSHVIAISDGCSLYFPYYNKSVEAEVYLVQDDANIIVEIPCKVGTPYPNKNSYHAYNFKVHIMTIAGCIPIFRTVRKSMKMFILYACGKLRFQLVTETVRLSS